MQAHIGRRSNTERTASTTADLLDAARALFVERGYADTATPDIVSAAGVTRGALYHHFADKKALFRAVVEREAASVAATIEAAAPEGSEPVEALLSGGDAFLAAMAEPGRVRLLLLDGPAVLGRAGMDEIDGRHGTRSLKAGLAAAMRAGVLRKAPLDPLASLLSSAWDRAAVDIAAGAPPEEYRKAFRVLVEALADRGDVP